MKYQISTIAILLFTFNLTAQSVNFNMENKVPLIFNPALTGINNDHGIASVFHQNAFPSLSTNFNTTLASYQAPLEILHGGLGVYYMNQKNVFQADNFGLSYSYQANLTRKLSLSFGTSVELIHNQQEFTNQIGDVYPNQLAPLQVNSNLGLLVFSQNIFFGGSVRNLSTTAPIHLMTTTGYRFNLLKDKSLKITPTLTYTYQNKFQNLTVKLNSSYKWAHISIGYGQGNSILFAGGVDIKNLSLNYGYNITTSKLTNYMGGIHEFSIRFRINTKKKLVKKGVRNYDFNIY